MTWEPYHGWRKTGMTVETIFQERRTYIRRAERSRSSEMLLNGRKYTLRDYLWRKWAIEEVHQSVLPSIDPEDYDKINKVYKDKGLDVFPKQGQYSMRGSPKLRDIWNAFWCGIEDSIFVANVQ